MKSKRGSCISHTFINSNVTYIQALQQEVAGRRACLSLQAMQAALYRHKKNLEVPYDVVTLNSETGINVNQAKLSPPQLGLCFL
jgi:hypothetical protein